MSTRMAECLAGAGGIEPPNGGIKIRCLTAWLRPNRLWKRRQDTADSSSVPPVYRGCLAISTGYADFDSLISRFEGRHGAIPAQNRPRVAIGDEHGIKLEADKVITAPGWPDAYRRWAKAGWNAVSGPEAFGGQGLPLAVNAACTEIWSASNIAFGLCPLLTLSAIEALDAHGSDELKKIYLEKLVSGEWTGTMQLTEPQAGSDVGALRTRAERAPDGSYRIKGTKIFITYGDHDMTDNIVH